MGARCSRVLCGNVSALCVSVPAVGVGKSDSNRLLRSKKSLLLCGLMDTEMGSFGGRFLGEINAFLGGILAISYLCFVPTHCCGTGLGSVAFPRLPGASKMP